MLTKTKEMTVTELNAKKKVVCDVECYIDYFMIGFKGVESGVTRAYEMYEGQPLDVAAVRRTLLACTIITFNGINYDMPMVALSLKEGTTNAMLKRASDAIITANLRPWQFAELFGAEISPKVDHIDISEVAPGVMISLKQYAARMHSKRLQDLPIEPSASITPEMRPLLKDYNLNSDLPATIDLWRALTKEGDNVIAIREHIGMETRLDLRSKSDAQVAETVIKTEIQRVTGGRLYPPKITPGTSYRYRPPAFIKFFSKVLQDQLAAVCESEFVVREDGKIAEPAVLKGTAKPVVINGRGYRMGIGGLHSMEKSTSHWADDNTLLRDVDVVSFYPELIRKCGLAPKNMGLNFTRIYGGWIDRRVAAKASGQTTVAQTLKIFLNGTFGKLGSPYSVLYAPDLLIQVTLTGQFMLLMMIERMEAAGIPVVSANTDGVVMKFDAALDAKRIEIVKQWETEADFKTEETRYAALCSKDVNNYIAIKEKGGYKSKGEYAAFGLAKNAEHEICNDAVFAYLQHGVPVQHTVHTCNDIRKFILAVKVTGGGVWGEPEDPASQYLGKVVRWIYREYETRDIRYKKANKTGGFNKVGKSDGALPMMILPDEIPQDLDRDRYVEKARGILEDLGITPDMHARIGSFPNRDLFNG